MRALPLMVLLVGGLLFTVLLMRGPAVVPVEHMVGMRVDLPQLEKTVQIVNVFASWCVPCAAEMPVLKGLDLPVIGIAYNDSADKVQAFLQRTGNPYARVIVDDGKAALALGITGVPETFLLDKNGVVRWHYPGALSETQLAGLKQAVVQWR